ncbi:MAG: toll/interleukin-1 receptor domain-containing protein [Acidobacteriota bacterium]|nr:toll/interleukin-1 receptor domain-containing protein [Acidobacteriota bacterium]
MSDDLAMAFLPDFETDIFISYARVDNETAAGGDGWVAQFVKHLEIELSKLAGRIGVVKLWWDPTLDDNQLFDDKIQKQINGSAIFLALTSNGYLKSDYCRKELRWFREHAEQHHGLKVGDRLRVVNVMLNNIPPESWPDEFQGAIGSKFHDAERDEDIGQPPMPNEEMFRKKLRKLSESIYRTLQAFPSAAESQPPKADDENKPDDSFVVYLADVSDTLQNRRDLIANELRQKGVRLLDPIPPPHEAAAHDTKLKTEIARADVAVHLLNEWGGRRMDGLTVTYPQRQVELGLQHAKSQLIWVPQSLHKDAIKEIEDATQRDLLAKLEDTNLERSRFRFIRESPSAIAREVLNHLGELKRQQQLAEAALIDTHPKDNQHASWLWTILKARENNALINPPVEDPISSLSELETRLREAARLIVVFGEVAEDWVRERLGHAIKFAFTEKRQLARCAVFFAPPRLKKDGLFDLGIVHVDHFDIQDLLNPETLADFLGKTDGQMGRKR